MNEENLNEIKYEKFKFTTFLPIGFLYTQSHYWLYRQSDNRWKVGLTKFATRMLGEMVDYGFEIKQNDKIEVGQILGWIEGFKAISDIYSVVNGRFLSINEILESNITIINRDPYCDGYLYIAEGEPDEKCIDVYLYQKHLDKVIELISKKMSQTTE
ncbi:MAG: glycine cleavage system protein H [Verrucomicrobiia bacterium]|jgi:glycine cleavage system H protein